MHVCDCNGVMSIVAASVLVPLLRDARLGPTIPVRLATLNERLKAYYIAHPGLPRLPELRRTNMYNEQGWACLSGSVVKAANTRALRGWLVELCAEFYAGPSENDRLVTRAVGALDRFYSVLYENDMILTAAVQGVLRRAILQFGTCLQDLRELSRSRGELLWQITPKCHYFQHLPELAACVNPRWVQKYTNGSHAGSITRI